MARCYLFAARRQHRECAFVWSPRSEHTSVGRWLFRNTATTACCAIVISRPTDLRINTHSTQLGMGGKVTCLPRVVLSQLLQMRGKRELWCWQTPTHSHFSHFPQFPFFSHFRIVSHNYLPRDQIAASRSASRVRACAHAAERRGGSARFEHTSSGSASKFKSNMQVSLSPEYLVRGDNI